MESDYQITRKRSLADVTYRIEKSLGPMIGHIPAGKFGSEQVRDYIALRRKTGVTDSTINRELSIVRRGFTLALRERPPLLTIAPYIQKMDETGNERQGFLEYEDYRKVLSHMPEQLKALFVVGYHTGMRLGELRKLQWDWVDLISEEIRIPAKFTKTKQPRVVPIYGEMSSWLQMQDSIRRDKWPECKFVFFWNGKPIGNRTRGWIKAVTAAGLFALRPHDLRRSAVRNMDRAGISRKLAMGITGHKTESMYNRYNITSKQDMDVVKNKLNSDMQSRSVEDKIETVKRVN